MNERGVKSDGLRSLPRRGFARGEFEGRVEGVQGRMRELGVDALLVTTEADVRYFSGFLTQFWESPTRPWFLVVPLVGEPIAVIPQIGVDGMEGTWVEDIRSWASPRAEDDGISLLVGCFRELKERAKGRWFGRVGMCLGAESVVRMPVNDFLRLRGELGGVGVEVVDAAGLMHRQRMVKSAAEVGKIRAVCGMVSDSFAALPGFAGVGMREEEVAREMRIDLLRRGVSSIPYLVAGSGAGGYGNIIMGPGERRLEEGDVLMIDTGATWDGYFCDFDRNFAFGKAGARTREAYRVVWEATEAGFAAARVGATTSDVWAAMNGVLVAGGSRGNAVGRLGHGLGMQLTERPSVTRDDGTRLVEGMVVTLEPGMSFLGEGGEEVMMVHEENIVIGEGGAEWLSRRAAEELVVL